jgi:hypothetical protein
MEKEKMDLMVKLEVKFGNASCYIPSTILHLSSWRFPAHSGKLKALSSSTCC